MSHWAYHSTVSYSLDIDQLYSNLHLLKKHLLWQRLTKTLIYRYNNMNLWRSLLLKQNNSIRFSARTSDQLAMVFVCMTFLIVSLLCFVPHPHPKLMVSGMSCMLTVVLNPVIKWLIRSITLMSFLHHWRILLGELLLNLDRIDKAVDYFSHIALCNSTS